MSGTDASDFLSVGIVHAGLERAFADVGILGYEYTLADGDFMDDWRWYPDTCHFYSDGYELSAQYFIKVWPERTYRYPGVKEALDSQVRSEEAAYKVVHWSAESPEYIRVFSDAFCFLKPHSCAHYFAAWMSLDLRGVYEPPETQLSARFFDELVGHGPCLAEVIRGFDGMKKTAIADFLIYSAQDTKRSGIYRLESKVSAMFALDTEYHNYASAPFRGFYSEWKELREKEEGEDKVVAWMKKKHEIRKNYGSGG